MMSTLQAARRLLPGPVLVMFHSRVRYTHIPIYGYYLQTHTHTHAHTHTHTHTHHHHHTHSHTHTYISNHSHTYTSISMDVYACKREHDSNASYSGSETLRGSYLCEWMPFSTGIYQLTVLIRVTNHPSAAGNCSLSANATAFGLIRS
jgi:hypothetical protein